MDLEAASFAELIRLQDRVSETVRRRFGRRLALAFTDAVASTDHLTRFGDEAGKRLQQRHVDVLAEEVQRAGGRVVDTAGDGAFACFPTADAAAASLVALHRRVTADNATRAANDALRLRAGLHVGDVLTDGAVVSGEAVHLAARLGQHAPEGAILASYDAFRELGPTFKLACARAPRVALKGFAEPVDLVVLRPHVATATPTRAIVIETGDVIPLPDRASIVSLGRLAPSPTTPGNDVVLRAVTSSATRRLGRFHVEVRRRADGMTLRSVSSATTEVDGVSLAKGAEARLVAGSIVRLAGVLTLRFEGPDDPLGDDASLATLTS